MTDRAFVDTNVLVYAYDRLDPVKQRIATELIENLWRSGCAVASTQVLAEFFVVVTRKVRRLLPEADAAQILDDLIRDWTIVPVTPEVVTCAVRTGMPHGLSFWDAMIWASAFRNGVRRIYSEDFAHGRDVGGVVFQNPFLMAGASPAPPP